MTIVILHYNQSDRDLGHTARNLMRRMLSPLCGLDQMIGFVSKSAGEARFVVAGAELTGVHLLRQEPQPKPGFYHIGGMGVILDEAIIRTLGETVERYCQLISEVGQSASIRFATYRDMEKLGVPILAAEKLRLFAPDQFAAKGFPFASLDPDAPLGWIPAHSVFDDETVWVPAQLVLVGYTIKRAKGEPWLSSAVTTGTAAHVDYERAFNNAILELIQIDAAMGHWYANSNALEIILDDRVAWLSSLIERSFPRRAPPPRFFWLPNADLPGATVACLITSNGDEMPAVGVGLGVASDLGEALYKALLEALGVAQLAKLTTFELSPLFRKPDDVGQGKVYDLDSNVVHYAAPENTGPLWAKFTRGGRIAASQLPPGIAGNMQTQITTMVDAFKATGKDLYFLDLTTSDARELGFRTVRLWSSDTLALCLPGAPPALHPRFLAYGGFQRADEYPHPYP